MKSISTLFISSIVSVVLLGACAPDDKKLETRLGGWRDRTASEQLLWDEFSEPANSFEERVYSAKFKIDVTKSPKDPLMRSRAFVSGFSYGLYSMQRLVEVKRLVELALSKQVEQAMLSDGKTTGLMKCQEILPHVESENSREFSLQSNSEKGCLFNRQLELNARIRSVEDFALTGFDQQSKIFNKLEYGTFMYKVELKRPSKKKKPKDMASLSEERDLRVTRLASASTKYTTYRFAYKVYFPEIQQTVDRGNLFWIFEDSGSHTIHISGQLVIEVGSGKVVGMKNYEIDVERSSYRRLTERKSSRSAKYYARIEKPVAHTMRIVSVPPKEDSKLSLIFSKCSRPIGLFSVDYESTRDSVDGVLGASKQGWGNSGDLVSIEPLPCLDKKKLSRNTIPYGSVFLR